MQEEQRSMQEDDEQVVSPSLRTQRILEHLRNQWQCPHEPSPDTLKRITEFVVSLPEKYRTAGLTAIADHLANNLILHFLDTMAIFCQKAEQEGIGLEEREEYTNYVLMELFSKMVGINRLVCVQSLEELTALTAITVNLQGLSRADTAEEAQDWMYELPKIYPTELLHENLIEKVHNLDLELDASMHVKPSPFTNWPSFEQNQAYVASGTGTAQATEQGWTTSTPKLTTFSLGGTEVRAA